MLLALLLHACASPQKTTNELTTPPNVVLFLVDDLGWTDLSGYGSELYRTPHTDALANDGVKFTNAYAACTVCSPTRASILTGKYPARVRCTDWISGYRKPFAKLNAPDWTQHIREEDVTIAEKLRELGYATIHLGKWHLGEEEKYWPEAHGFDKNLGGWKVGMPKRKKKQGGYFVPYYNPRLEDGPEGEYLTERLASEATEYIRSHQDQPFFMNFWFYNVHTPLQARQQKIAKYDSLVDPASLQSNATYAAMVEHMDEAIGAVVHQLKASGIYDNTIIVFASDNGGLTGTEGKLNKKPTVTSNAPLKSGKGDMYEGGVRTPFIVSWPKKIPAGRVSEHLTTSPDIYPTILGLLDKSEAMPAEIDGMDLSAHLVSGVESRQRALFWHYPHYHTEGAVPHSAIRSDQWKLIINYESEEVLLFDLHFDIGETVNLAEERPAITKDLEAQLQQWKASVNAQEPIPNKNHDPAKAHQWKSKWH